MPGGSLEAFVRAAPRLLVLTGAGCSTAAGIPDYRDETGAWKHRPPVQFQEFMGSHAVRQRYWARSMVGWLRVSAARPTEAHTALAQLEGFGRITALVTQNVDGLHQRAGSGSVIDLHGRLDAVCCMDCGVRIPREAMQSDLVRRNPAWAGLTAAGAPDGDARLEGPFEAFDVPPCGSCAGVLKPDVVFFGENVPKARVAECYDALAAADGLLVVGSSLMVFSGYRFCLAAVEARKPVAVVNRGRTRADEIAALKIDGDCGEALGRLAASLA